MRFDKGILGTTNMHKVAKMKQKIGNKEENKVDFHGRVARLSAIIFSPAAAIKRHRAVTMAISRKCFKVKADGWLVKKNNCAGGKVGLRA